MTCASPARRRDPHGAACPGPIRTRTSRVVSEDRNVIVAAPTVGTAVSRIETSRRRAAAGVRATRTSPRGRPASRRSSGRGRRRRCAGGRSGPAAQRARSAPPERGRPAQPHGRAVRVDEQRPRSSGRPPTVAAVLADPRRSVRKLSNLDARPGRSTTRVIERFQKSSWSEFARTPLYDWSSVTSPTLRPVDPGGVARQVGLLHGGGVLDVEAHRARRGGTGREQGEAEDHGRTESRASRGRARRQRHQPDRGGDTAEASPGFPSLPVSQ